MDLSKGHDKDQGLVRPAPRSTMVIGSIGKRSFICINYENYSHLNLKSTIVVGE